MTIKPKWLSKGSRRLSLQEMAELDRCKEKYVSDLQNEVIRLSAWRCNPDFVPEGPCPVIAKIRPYPGFALLRYNMGTWQRFDEFKGWEDYPDKNIISWRNII